MMLTPEEELQYKGGGQSVSATAMRADLAAATRAVPVAAAGAALAIAEVPDTPLYSAFGEVGERLDSARLAETLTAAGTPAAAFADPDAVLDLIRAGAPYKTQEAAHKHPNVTHTGGWFRNFWALGGKIVFDGAEPFFHNPTFINAAKDSFGAEIIRPVAMMTNLNLPADGLPPHLDLPRGP